MTADIYLDPPPEDATGPDFDTTFSAVFEVLKRIIVANHAATADELDQYLSNTVDTHVDRVALDMVCLIEGSWEDIVDEIAQSNVTEPVQTAERNALT